MARGRKPKKQAAVTEDDLETDLDGDSEEEESDADDDIVLSDDDDLDDDGETLELPTLSEISGAAASASARRRVEEYLEMRRAARELHELEDFDFD
ncbi:MAG: hypothetical protein AMJ59_09065 [Gammaproteobacteria bacterium SG8_31]|jgi:hypothetical protein|nr:MAG: hypothetical protein AMJ59_09065 [Gammaproteobacteria bacterium SG8_31]